MVLATQLSAVLHAGYRVTRPSFLNSHLCFSKLSRAGVFLLRSESVILLVASLYAEARGSKVAGQFIGFSSELIWILGEVN
jgi:hypothetical protein